MPRHPGRTRPLLALIAVVAVTTLATACGTSGRSMQEPEPGATAPPRRPDVSTTTGAGFNTLIPSQLFTLASPAFAPNGDIPVEYSCDDVGNAPPLTWANVPAGTVELVLLVTDPEADGFIHWVVAGIDPTTTALGPRVAPAGSVELRNSASNPGYAPLCPPAGQSHTYEFTLYSLSAPSGLTPDSDAKAAAGQVASGATGIAVLTGSYTRNTAN
ncbi:MAG: YbhB/YbcL family Raf kinase inhibitor-like protein [Acidimicrobiales bacterium]